MQKIAIIGAGSFGSIIALELSKYYKIDLFEANENILLEASANNLNRVHAGYHYPRDQITTLQSINSYQEFCKRFKKCINFDFKNYYLISKTGSKTTSSQYLNFMNKNSLSHRIINKKDFFTEIKNIELIVQVDEYVYDIKLFRKKILDLIKNSSVNLKLSEKVVKLTKSNNHFILKTNKNYVSDYKYIINTTYKNYNTINDLVSMNLNKIKYQYTFSNIVKFKNYSNFGLTLLDGKFFTILPYGKSNYHLLYDVEHSVIKSRISKLSNLINKPNSFDSIKSYNEKKMIDKINLYMPNLCKNISFKGHLEATRVIKPFVEKSDQRRMTLFNEKGFLSIFSSKVDHSILASKIIYDLINK